MRGFGLRKFFLAAGALNGDAIMLPRPREVARERAGRQLPTAPVVRVPRLQWGERDSALGIDDRLAARKLYQLKIGAVETRSLSIGCGRPAEN